MLVERIIRLYSQRFGKLIDVRLAAFSGRQDVLVSAGQVAPDLGKLRTNQIAVVEQPLGSGRQSVIEAYGLRENRSGRFQRYFMAF